MCHVGTTLRVSSQNLDAICVHLGLRTYSKVEMHDFTEVLEVFSGCMDQDTRLVDDHVCEMLLFFVLAAFLRKGLEAMSLHNSKVLVFHWFYK